MFLIFAFEFLRVTLFGFKPLTYPLFRVKYKLKMTELDLLTSILVNNDSMLTKLSTIIRESILKYIAKYRNFENSGLQNTQKLNNL